MDNILVRSIKLVLLAGCLGNAGISESEEVTGLLGIYPFADHGSMHFRTQPLVDFLRQRHVSLQLDVSNTYDELLQRALRQEYVALQVPVHFGLYLQRCCGYHIVGGWRDPISAFWLELDVAVPPPQSNHPVPLAVASPLSLVSMAITGGCASQTTIDGRLHTLVSSGTHERALQALLRGKVAGAIVSTTALRTLQPELRKRLRIKKEIAGLRGDVFLVRTASRAVPGWQVALEREFPASREASEMQDRWHRPQGVATVADLLLQPAELYAAQLGSCLRGIAALNPATTHP